VVGFVSAVFLQWINAEAALCLYSLQIEIMSELNIVAITKNEGN
jgi:hypothetical protein